MKARDAEQLERWLREPETILADIKAAQTPKRKNTDPRPLHVTKAMDDGRARAKAERQRRSRERAEASYDARVAAKRMTAGKDIKLQFIQAMQPGEWHAYGDVVRAIGMSRGMRFRMLKALTAMRWVERTHNPAHTGVLYSTEPQWLYRLTPLGESERLK